MTSFAPALSDRTMKPSEALEHLDTALQEVRRLIGGPPQSRSMDAWHQRTKIAIEHIFGAGSRQLRDFENVNYSLSIWTSSTPERVFEEAKLDGLRSAERLLQSLRDEVTTFGIGNVRRTSGSASPNVELERITLPILLHGMRRLTIKSWILIGSVAALVFSAGSLAGSFRHAPEHGVVTDSLHRQVAANDSLRGVNAALTSRSQRVDSTLRKERDSLKVALAGKRRS